MPEKPHEEFARLVREHNDANAVDSAKKEARNLIADFALENAATITAALLASQSTPAPPEVATHRHVKSGHEVAVVATGRMQSSRWLEELAFNGHVEARTSIDMREVIIYRHDGNWWVRPLEEFEDGRFAPLPAQQEQG